MAGRLLAGGGTARPAPATWPAWSPRWPHGAPPTPPPRYSAATSRWPWSNPGTSSHSSTRPPKTATTTGRAHRPAATPTSGWPARPNTTDHGGHSGSNGSPRARARKKSRPAPSGPADTRHSGQPPAPTYTSNAGDGSPAAPQPEQTSPGPLAARAERPAAAEAATAGPAVRRPWRQSSGSSSSHIRSALSDLRGPWTGDGVTNVVVTGGAGFVGSRLARVLAGRGLARRGRRRGGPAVPGDAHRPGRPRLPISPPTGG